MGLRGVRFQSNKYLAFRFLITFPLAETGTFWQGCKWNDARIESSPMRKMMHFVLHQFA